LAPRAKKPGPFVPAPLPVAALGEAERLACLRLIRTESVGPVTFRDLINHCGGAEPALAALPEIARRAGRSRPLAICPASRAEAELDAARRAGAEPVFTIEPGYPPALAQLDVPPPLLYLKGRKELLLEPMVAIVGSRNASAAGSRMTRLIAATLGEAGYVIASGLARGIDGAAHDAALPTGTIAVLAGGIDFVYPPENAALHERIAAEGCLLSEMPPGFRPRAQDFPRRNRIISGVALGLVVVEAARRSGSLITARTAAEQGRLVMAVPGHPLDPRAEGPLQLIRDGATMITTPADCLAELAPLRAVDARAGAAGRRFDEPVTGPLAQSWEPEAQPAAGPSDAPAFPSAPAAGDFIAAVLGVLGPAPVTLDEITRATGLPSHVARATLLELTIAGRIEQHGGQLVSLKPE
jgi:DNA processing protein